MQCTHATTFRLCLLCVVLKSKQKFDDKATNKCIRFCLALDNQSHIGVNEFKAINWLPVQNRYEQCVSARAFKFCKGPGPAYMSDIYIPLLKTRELLVDRSIR